MVAQYGTIHELLLIFYKLSKQFEFKYLKWNRFNNSKCFVIDTRYSVLDSKILILMQFQNFTI